MPAPLDVALLGYGLAGRVFHAPLIAATPGLRLHTVVSRDPAAVAADHPHARVVADPAQAFADPAIGLVVVATPNHTHSPLALAALDAGKHVVVDKPFALDAAEAESMIEAAGRAGRVLSVFHNRRWDADFLALRALVETGGLGDVMELHSHFDRFRPQVPDRWRDREGPGSGLWYDLGPHLVDQALQLFGPPLAVCADLGRQRDGASAVDWFHVRLRYARLRVLLHAGTLVPGHGLRFAAHGTGGSWIKHGLDPQEEALRAGHAPGGADWGRDPQPGAWLRVDADGTVREAAATGPRGDYTAYYARLRDALVDGAPPPVTAQEALLAMRVIDAGIASAAQGREVAFAG
ncbi:oxidoreductase [Pseudoxanthomonas broegbernensis]|uniref:Oxidoreductase n=1 Tax=Pseudoxanthomonas broegbernensis TaxID=83619 RepID=A0A7V8GNZ6_9GAMM|nr:oxidoreductase [Pseudoxanthomonas broegbernensis]KAF1687368.1 oxidoreductase [Pseudoxanthomonas broegbernensis]MBB6065629.1 putative dehydrogenase [Pseudoxanthomonas broegbernensis]